VFVHGSIVAVDGLRRGSGYDAVLRWEQPEPEPDLAGFMIVVRSTTAPDWDQLRLKL